MNGETGYGEAHAGQAGPGQSDGGEPRVLVRVTVRSNEYGRTKYAILYFPVLTSRE